MYRILADGNVIYDSSDASECLIGDASLNTELYQASSLEFTMYPQHPHYGELEELTSFVEVWQDEEQIFSGRVLSIDTDLYKTLKVYCEGDFTFLVDSEMEPFQERMTVRDFFELCINSHNAQVEARKQFAIGEVTHDKADTEMDFKIDGYTQTQSALTGALTDALGGFFRIRYPGGVRTIDYIQKYGRVNTQPITVGENIIDKNDHSTGENLFSVLRPLGKDNLTIEGASDENLFPADKLTRGAKLVSGLTELIKDSKDWCYLSGYMPVTSGETYIFAPSQCRINFYDASQVCVGTFDSSADSMIVGAERTQDMEVTAPEGAAFARMSFPTVYKDRAVFKQRGRNLLGGSTTKNAIFGCLNGQELEEPTDAWQYTGLIPITPGATYLATPGSVHIMYYREMPGGENPVTAPSEIYISENDIGSENITIPADVWRFVKIAYPMRYSETQRFEISGTNLANRQAIVTGKRLDYGYGDILQENADWCYTDDYIRVNENQYYTGIPPYCITFYDNKKSELGESILCEGEHEMEYVLTPVDAYYARISLPIRGAGDFLLQKGKSLIRTAIEEVGCKVIAVPERISRWGYIIQTHQFQDIDDPQTLYNAALEFINRHLAKLPKTCSITLVDFHHLNPDVDIVALGDEFEEIENFDESLTVGSLKRDLRNPQNDSVTLENEAELNNNDPTSSSGSISAAYAKGGAGSGGYRYKSITETLDDEDSQYSKSFEILSKKIVLKALGDLILNAEDTKTSQAKIELAVKGLDGSQSKILMNSAGIKVNAKNIVTSATGIYNIADSIVNIAVNAYTHANLIWNEAKNIVNIADNIYNVADTVFTLANHIHAEAETMELIVGEMNLHAETFNADIGTLNANIGTIHANIDRIDGHIGEIDVDIDSIEADIGTINTTIGTINTTIGTINADIGTINTTIGTINADIGTINTTIGTINADIGTINADIDSIEADIGTINTTIGTINTTIGTINADIGTINADIDSIEADIGTINTTIGTINTTIGTINADIGTINADIDSIEADIGTINTTIGTINADIGTINADIDSVKADIGDLFIEVDTYASVAGRVTTVEGKVSTIEGSALWQDKDDITAAVGKLTVDSNGNLHVVDGSGLYLDDGSASFGVYTEGNLTAGVIVSKITTDNTSSVQSSFGTYINGKLDAGVMVEKITGDSGSSSNAVKMGTFVGQNLDAGVLVNKIVNNTDSITVASFGTYVNNQLDAGVMVEKITGKSQGSKTVLRLLGDEIDIRGNTVIQGMLTVKTVGAQEYYVLSPNVLVSDAESSGSTLALSSHTHQITVANDGTVTLGGPTNSAVNPNLADTSWYKNRVGQIMTAVATVSRTGWANGHLTINSSVHADLSYSYSIMPPTISLDRCTFRSRFHTYLLDVDVGGSIQSLAVDDTTAYDTGWMDAAGVFATSGGTGQSFTVNRPNSSSVGTTDTITFSMAKGTPSANGGYASVSLNGTLMARIDISDWWDEGYDAGLADATITVMLDNGNWTSGNITVTAKDGDSNTLATRIISAPTISYDSRNYVSSGKLYSVTVNVGGANQTFTMSASEAYNAGYADGWAAAVAKISIPSSGSGASNSFTVPSATVDESVTHSITTSHDVTIRNVAAGRYSTQGYAYTYIDGNAVAQRAIAVSY